MADRPMLFSTPIATTMDGQMFVLALANRVCQYLPDGWELRLCMEKGAAWVTLHNPDGDTIDLPDAADKSLEQQVNEALCEARAADELERMKP